MYVITLLMYNKDAVFRFYSAVVSPSEDLSSFLFVGLSFLPFVDIASQVKSLEPSKDAESAPMTLLLGQTIGNGEPLN